MSVHLIQNGASVHAVVDVMDFQGTEDPAQVTCETCQGILTQATQAQEGVNRALGNAAQAMGEPAPPDDLESLSLAEHLGLLVASHVTALEQQRDQARMWAVTLEGQLAEVVTWAREAAEVLERQGTTFAADTRAMDRLNSILKAVGSPYSPDHPEDAL